ncbi:hypothetical protein RI129_000694 [Pyrocoelia pectoralis]|uniref:Polycystin cation channel PKD1/PKD2 domain-containing protein n=1 Tax=Pyrocoelia pectoralis TaxID=417401 RepID=A0AAN7VKV8_9COLE
MRILFEYPLVKSFSVRRYSHIDSLDSLVYPGKLAYYPGTRGYVVNLAIQNISDNTSNSILVLKENLFLSRGTRVLFLEFATYNPNTNLFCVVKIVFEFPPTGGVLTSYIFRVVRLIRYVTIFDYALLACEVVVLVFILGYTILFIVEIRHLSGAAFSRFWSYGNFFILLTGYVILGLNILRSIKFKEAQSTLLSKDTYVNLEQPAVLLMAQDDATAIFVFLVYMKAFKFLAINKTVGQINTTIRKCLSDIVTFLVLLLIVFIVFGLFGYMMFHSQVAEFSSYGVAMFTLFRAILGEFDYEAIESANSYVAPIYFILFMFVVFFIMLNMFLAIINEAYYHVKLDIAARHKHKQMSYYVKQAFYELFCLSDTASQDDIDETPNQVAISEIRDALNR